MITRIPCCHRMWTTVQVPTAMRIARVPLCIVTICAHAMRDSKAMEQPARQVSENQYIWSLCRFIRIYQIHFISILSNTFSNRVEQPYSRSLSRSTNCGFFFPFAREKKSTKFICPFLLFLHQTRESMSLLMRRVLPLTAGSLMIARHFSQRFFLS